MAKIRQIIDNSAADCPISLKFTTEYDHMTQRCTTDFKGQGSKVKVTAWQRINSKNAMSGGDRLTEFKPVENYPTAAGATRDTIKYR